MRIIYVVLAIAFLVPLTAHAYRMPAYHIAQEDWPRPAEEVFGRFARRMDEIDSVASLYRLENHRRCHRCNLTRKEREVYQEYLNLKVPYTFWNYVVDLKGDLMTLTDGRGAEGEADAMAKKIIQKLYDLSNEYQVAGSALINNLLINMKAKDKGFCYHYTEALRTMLTQGRWRHYDFHWGAAYDGTWLENNALIITAKGKPFESGIVVDAWRTASRPYWNRVKNDRYPWIELKEVDLAR